ncbi:helix-turn-helix domain-containing protein [Enterococcus sp. LJL99]
MELSFKLQKRRKELKLTQEEVAEKIHVSRQTISNWETGRTLPDISSLILISDIYKVSLDTLLKEDQEMVKHLQKATDENRSLKLFCLLLFINSCLIVSLMFVSNQVFSYSLLFLVVVNTGYLFYLIIKRI